VAKVSSTLEDEDLRAAGQLAGEPDREPVRIRRRERELPAREAEAPRQLAPDPDRVLARKHQRDPAARLLGERPHRRLRRVTRHRRGVAEAEVDVLVPVHVAEARSLRVGREDREAAGPADHPRHRHPGE
jgi:hypothetical protein